MHAQGVDSTPAEDVIPQAEVTSKEPQVVVPEEAVKTVVAEDGEEGLEDLTEDQVQVENSDEDEEEKDVVGYSSSFMEREDAELFRPAGEPATDFGDFIQDDDDDDAEDED